MKEESGVKGGGKMGEITSSERIRKRKVKEIGLEEDPGRLRERFKAIIR